MSNNKITIEQAKQQLTEGFSSILTREDVLHLLDCLEVTEGNGTFTEDQINSLSADIANEIVDLGTDIIEEYELSMSYKEVELDSVDFSHSGIQDTVFEAIKHFLKSND